MSKSLLILLCDSPFQHESVDQAIEIARTALRKGHQVSIFLMQDSVYLALKDAEHSGIVGHAIEQGVGLHLLDEDVKKRGIRQKLMPGLELASYDQLVDLLFNEDPRVINL